jgi:hypothetical protein
MTRLFRQKSANGLISEIGLLFLLTLLTLVNSACSAETSQPTQTPPFPTPEIPDLDLPISSRDYLVGTAGLIPPHFPDPTEEDYLEFLAELPYTGEIVGVYTDWSAPDLINSIQFAETYAEGVDPLVALGFDFEIIDDTYFSRNLPGIRNAVREILDTFELDYLAFGVEANRLGPEVSAAAWLDYVAAYREIYDLVKLRSPETKVFPIFQLEYLKGAAMLSGLELQPQWEILEDFEGKIDLVGLTIYPFLEYTSVDKVPADYYAEIPEKINFPIAITEMAWLSENVSIIEGSEHAQVEFLLRILEETQDWDLEMMLHSFLYEPHGVDLFESAALKTYEGEAKEVYRYWLALAALK